MIYIMERCRSCLQLEIYCTCTQLHGDQVLTTCEWCGESKDIHDEKYCKIVLGPIIYDEE